MMAFEAELNRVRLVGIARCGISSTSGKSLTFRVCSASFSQNTAPVRVPVRSTILVAGPEQVRPRGRHPRGSGTVFTSMIEYSIYTAARLKRLPDGHVRISWLFAYQPVGGNASRPCKDVSLVDSPNPRVVDQEKREEGQENEERDGEKGDDAPLLACGKLFGRL